MSDICVRHVRPCLMEVSRDELIAWLIKQPTNMVMVSPEQPSVGKNGWFPHWILNKIHEEKKRV